MSTKTYEVKNRNGRLDPQDRFERLLTKLNGHSRYSQVDGHHPHMFLRDNLLIIPKYEGKPILELTAPFKAIKDNIDPLQKELGICLSEN